MKNKITTIIFGLLLSTMVAAQPVSDSLKAIYDSIPAHLYPSGLLHNQSPFYHNCFFTDTNLVWQLDSSYKGSPYLYPGHIPAPLITRMQWARIFQDMRFSSTDTNLLPAKPTLNNAMDTARTQYEVAIGAQHLNFHRIVHGAVDSGYLHYDADLKKIMVMPDTVWINDTTYRYTANPDSLAQLAFAAHEVFGGVLSQHTVYKGTGNFNITFGFGKRLDCREPNGTHHQRRN